MENNVLFVGLDVDDNAFHGCATRASTSYDKEFDIRPTTNAIVKKLLDLKRELNAAEVRVCYEAS